MRLVIDIHPTLQLDPNVERQNESHHHWAIKSVIVNRLRSNPSYSGTIETEKKTSDQIADIRCQLTNSPPGVPHRFVIEIETTASNKDRLQSTIEHLRFGYSIYWVFEPAAMDARLETEGRLRDHMRLPPSLGIVSLPNGELTLGAPITWEEFQFPPPVMGSHEFYVPTYRRSASCYNHGDFSDDGERFTVYGCPGKNEYYISRYLEGGQQTLPQLAPPHERDLPKRIERGKVKRVGPVRGTP
ncbi:hypothetical protein [Halosimplex halobium]|uniref:hypothetical protein n=1 Tax=Halosimplex halobium TaxID=3396618 RepID=UPI003F57DE13